MPLMFVNPGRRRRRVKRNPKRKLILKKRRAARRRKANPLKRKSTTKRRIVKLVKRKRKSPAKRRRSNPRRRRVVRRKNPKRVAAGRKAARTRKRRIRNPAWVPTNYGSDNTKKKTRKKKASSDASSAPKKRRKRRQLKARRIYRKKSKAHQRQYHVYGTKTKYWGNPRRRRRKNPRRTIRRYARKNPSRRYRRNPGAGGKFVSVLKNTVKRVLPIGLSIIAAKAAAAALDKQASVAEQLTKLGKAKGVVVAGALTLLGHVATKKVLRKHRFEIMTGLVLNMVHRAFADIVVPALPDSIKGHLALSEYVDMKEYVDMSQYIQMDGYQSQLEGYESELGEFYGETGEFYGEMGDNAGLYQTQLRSVPSASGLYPAASVPALVPSSPFSEADLYSGIFAGAKIG